MLVVPPSPSTKEIALADRICSHCNYNCRGEATRLTASLAAVAGVKLARLEFGTGLLPPGLLDIGPRLSNVRVCKKGPERRQCLVRCGWLQRLDDFLCCTRYPIGMIL